MAANYEHLVDIIFAAQGVGATKEQIQQVFKTLQTGNKTTTETTQKMGDLERALRRAAIVAPVWMALRAAMMGVLNLIKEQAKFLVDFENAMARIQIVGKGTAEEYQRLGESILQLSYAYGISASKGLDAAVIFAQQGKSISETITLTRAAMIGAQVLGQDVAVVVEDLTAAMNSFNISSTNAVSILDSLMNVERNFAVTSKDLSSGIKVVGATANQMGVSMAALTGDITAVVEVTRKSGQEAARGLQFIYARLLTSAKPVIESLTGIKFYLDEQGKSTTRLTGTLRSATDILDELAPKWATLTNQERLNIAVATGSKRQLVVLNSLMQNYAHSLDARIAALTSAGAAEKALSIVQDTVSYKLQQLTSSWNILTTTIANTAPWKGAIDQIQKTVLGLAILADKTAGFKFQQAEVAQKILSGIEIKQSQLNSVEELIKLRDKLIAQPPTDKTTERLNIINQALENIGQRFPSIKIAIDEQKSLEEVNTIIEKIQNALLEDKISVQVTTEFAPQIREIEDKIKELKEVLKKPMSAIELTAGIPAKYINDIKTLEQTIVDLKEKQTKEEQKQLTSAKAEQLKEIIDSEEESAELSGELTDKEKEQLDIERQLIRYKIAHADSTDKQIQQEIQLVQASKYVYEEREKTLKLEKLHNDLLDATLKKREEERNKVAALAIQYEQADMMEKTRIKRVTELQKLSPEEIARRFEDDVYDKNIMLEYWNSFSQEAQRAIEDTSMRLNELSATTPFQLQMEGFERILEKLRPTIADGANQTPLNQQNININNKGAEVINVALYPTGMKGGESAEVMAEYIKRELMTNKDFQDAWIKIIGKKI